MENDFLPVRKWSDAQSRFVADFVRASAPSPLPAPNAGIARVYQSYTRIVLYMRTEGDVWLGAISCSRPDEGHGGAALSWLCRLGDRHRLPISVMAWPLAIYQTPLAQLGPLEAWYERRGFSGPGLFKTRAPSPEA